MKNLFIAFIILLSACGNNPEQNKIQALSLATSESSIRVTYDTIIKSSDGKVAFAVRMTRPQFDTASRPAFITMPGKGEINTDTNILKKNTRIYGPHYWFEHGWDGSVTLGNGIHYPYLITICPSVADVRPGYIKELLLLLIKKYHVKTSSLHFAGLSMGGWTLGRFLCYSTDGKETSAMAMMRSFVALQGNAADNFNGVSFGTTAYRKWVELYDGRYFALEGTADGRNLWVQRDSMVKAGSTKAFFAYEKIGGGTHCCWNSMYDPSVTDWTSKNPNIVNRTDHVNSLGDYTGGNIFQWMLRQGDTSFAAQPVPPDTIPPVVVKKYTQVGVGEYVANFLNEKGEWYIVGALSETGGYGKQLGIPAHILPGQTFAGVCGALHNNAAWDSAGYVYTVGDNAEGQLGKGDVSTYGGVYKILTDSAGNEFKDVVKVVGHYLYGSGTGFYAIKKDGSLWYWGSGKGGMRGNGTPGSLTTRPARITMPGNRLVKDLVAGYIAIALCTDSTVSTWGGGSNSTNLGYAGSGFDYQSPHLLNLTGIEQIAGGIYFNYAYKKDSLFGWGNYGEYMAMKATLIKQPTYCDSIMESLPAPIKKITTITLNSYAILLDGSLWAWGDNAMGGVGNGKEPDYGQLTPPYAYPFKRAMMMQTLPIRILDSMQDISGSSVYTFYAYATMRDNSLRAWGRNKGAVIANGVVPCSSQEAATFANGWDVTTPQFVDPFNLKKTIVTPNPYCIKNPTISPCSQCAVIQPIPQPEPIDTIPASVDQSFSPGTIILVAPVKDTIGYIFQWSKLLGASVSMNPAKYSQDIIKGLKIGFYKFNLRLEKNGVVKNTVYNITIN